jgi:hypothetical protein
MAVRIPIVTVFDSKGLKQAQYELNKVRGNFQNLGRNFAIAGAALAGGVALIGKSLRDAADSQRVFAQTEAVLKSTGTTANGTAKDIQALAASLQKSTAFNDEAILAGQNLLLTFKGVRNEAGKGNDIFNQASQTMLDFARATNTDASSAAIKLGKALQDPTRGVTALRKSGVDFTKDQMEMIKSLQESGDLMSAQKIVLAELQAQFGGSAAAYAQTFAGQVESLNNELNDLSEEIGFMVMPAVRDMVAAFRELAPEVGSKLKAAVASVDWKAFTKTIVDLTTFLIQNADAIIKVVTALFTLNTLYNASRAVVGLYTAATFLLGNTFTTTAGKIGLATGALKLFRTALMLTGIGAVIVALGLIVQGATEVDSTYRKTTPVVTSFGTAVLNSGKDAEWAAARYGTAAAAAQGLANAAASLPKPGRTSVMDDYGYNIRTKQPVPKTKETDPFADLLPDLTKVSGTAKAQSPLQTLIDSSKKDEKILNKTNALIGKNLPKDVAQWVASSSKPVVALNQVLRRVSKNGPKAIGNLTRAFQNSAAGQAAAAAAIAKADADAQAAKDKADQDAAEKLRQQEATYKSFADSIVSVFSSIKDSIVGAFSLPELGGSTDSIIRNMDKLLARVRAFSTNISQLSTMGLNPTLLAQVIQAGPVAGARLAAGLVAGGADALARINTGFGEIQTLGSEIGMTGTQSRFGTTQQQQIINVNINGGLDSSAAIGKAVVDAVRAYERTSGAVWQGA